MSSGIDLATRVSPLATLVRGVIEWKFPASSWDELHAEMAPGHETRKLTIASLAWLMVQVVSGARRSVFAAFKADRSSSEPTIQASYQAVYGRLGRMTPDFSCALVRHSAQRCGTLLKASGCQHLPGWKGFRIRIIDGTQPDGSEHRLKVLRTIKAAGMPCRFVVQFDPATGLCTDAIAAQDSYASEQLLAKTLFERAEPSDLFVADRHFATTQAFLQLVERAAYLLVREHAPQVVLQTLGKTRRIGRVDTGVVSEQPVELTDKQSGQTLRVRRVILQLDQPTGSGDTELRLLTNLPPRVSALKVARLYRQRWTIESHFDLIKNELHGEIESLGKPPAAIFALCMSMVAANALAVVTRAIAAAHGEELAEQLSGYYLADEIAGNYRAIDALLEPSEWEPLAAQGPKAFWRWCRQTAEHIQPAAFVAHPRGPKHPPPKRASGKHRHSYSTYRLIEAAKKRC